MEGAITAIQVGALIALASLLPFIGWELGNLF